MNIYPALCDYKIFTPTSCSCISIL